MKKTNYLNNKDILSEIHKSKNTFCSFSLPEYHQYDAILSNINQINTELINIAKSNRAKRINQGIDIENIPNTDLVFRIMTFDHIPDQPGRKKNPKSIADQKIKLNFPPFQHWKFNITMN